MTVSRVGFGNGHFLHIRGTRGLVQTKRKGPSTQVELVNFLYTAEGDLVICA
jgi:hypothetical protein